MSDLNMKTICHQIVVAERVGNVELLTDLLIEALSQCRNHGRFDHWEAEAIFEDHYQAFWGRNEMTEERMWQI